MINKHNIFLVVDDFEPMRVVTSGQLREMGAIKILSAENGAEALRILQTRRVDIVLSDWNMPIMTGLELLKAVRADEKLMRIPFIMITAEAERHRIDEAIANCVTDLLVKPYTVNSLASRIENALSARPQSKSPVRVTPEVKPTKEMPLDPAPSPVIIETGNQDIQGKARPTILVVDDLAPNLLLLTRAFEGEYRMRIAHNGEKALAICQSDNPPDLVLLDIMMPGMDGFEVVRRMREHPTSETIPVIFVTAMSDDDSRLKGMELGAVDFVTKPIDFNVLKPRVRNFMRYVALHKQLQANYDNMLELARLREDVDHITRHDMKGPLAGVIGLVQALAGSDSMKQKEIGQLGVVEKTVLEVLNMINLSSELFKIETGRFKLDARPVVIGDILRRIVEISRTTYAEKRLVIAIDTDVPVGDEIPQVLGDTTFCYSLFQNLIKNACEAAPDKSRVTVTLNEETPLRIIIQNKGVVPAEIRERFFDKFVTHGKEGGSGLGTYSAKLLTEAQNGTISMEGSEEKNQTTITVTLPRYAEEAP